jgi:glyoxylate reductase
MLHKVFVTRRIPESGLRKLQQATDCRVWPGQLPPSPEELREEAAGCDGLVTLLSDRIDGAVMDAIGPQLKVIANYAVGFNNIDVAAADERGIRVGNTPGVLTEATADIAVGLLLAAARCFGEGFANVAERKWQTWEPLGFVGQDLRERTVGIIGFGRIGQAVARRLRFGWDMQVLYFSRTDKPAIDQELGSRRVELDELLTSSDFISVNTSLTPSTRHLIDSAALERMKPHAVLVNTARGEIIDQDALYEALRSGQIFAAGLDVTAPEPLPDDSPLRQLSNCLILPHIGSATHDSRNAMANIAAENTLAGLNGNPLPHGVN